MPTLESEKRIDNIELTTLYKLRREGIISSNEMIQRAREVFGLAPCVD